jgi:hypothetical protein
MSRSASWSPQVGAECVDLRSGGPTRAGMCGEVVTVKTVTDTIVVTSDGERYSRVHLAPISEGRHSDRRLVPAHDDRVLCVHGRRMLRDVAQLAANLSAIDRRDPADIVAALAQIATAATGARGRLLGLMQSASRKGQ